MVRKVINPLYIKQDFYSCNLKRGGGNRLYVESTRSAFRYEIRFEINNSMRILLIKKGSKVQ